MKPSIREEFLLTMRKLVSSGFERAGERNPVKQTKEALNVEGFGSFRVLEYPGHTGRRISNGERILVASSFQVAFRIDTMLSAFLNTGHPISNIDQSKNENSSGVNSWQTSGLGTRLREIQAAIMNGEKKAELLEVGVFTVRYQEKSGVIRSFLLFEANPSFNRILQSDIEG